MLLTSDAFGGTDVAQMTSGKVLREARERKGYDLNTVARRLRIRPDILRAIEAGDFEAMPPRGYTRNMVNAYARLLGLNPTEIVNMYLDEAYAEQVERARDKAPSSGFTMERESRIGIGRSFTQRNRTARTTTQVDNQTHRKGSYDPVTGSYTRDLYDDRTQFSRDDYGITRERTKRPGRSDRDFMSHHSGYESTNFGFLDSGGTRPVHVGQTPMQYSASRVPGFLQSRLVLGIAAIVVIIIIVVVVFLFLNGRNAPADDDVSQLPVSGISDTTGTADNEDTTGMVEVAPSSSHVVITVKQGEECYFETYQDNKMTPYTLDGPAQENIEVTGVLTVATWNPEIMTVTVDNVEVELVSNPEFNDMYAYTIDFPKILEEWRSTHTSREAQRSAAVANATNATAQGSSSQSEDTQPAEEQNEEEQSEEDEENAEESEDEEW